MAMSPIRVCQLITELRPAGAERCVYELARRLDRRRFDVCVAALRGGEVAERLAAEGIPVHLLNVRGKWDVLKLPRLARLLREHRIDLLHTHLFHADLAGRPAAMLARVPRLVHTVHVAEARFRPWRFTYARLTSRLCDRIVCVSQSVFTQHSRRSGLPVGRYTVIPNGIDTEAFSRDDARRRELRSQWRLGENEVLLAFVGRLDKQKGVDTLLEAMSMLAERGAAPRLVIAGAGPQRKIIERFVDSPAGSTCRYLGFVHDVRGLLSAADVLVMPSRWEGLPLVAVEAMAAGLPVIASRCDGLKDVVIDGRTGLFVAPDDAAELAGQIERLAADGELRRRQGSAGRGHVVRNFDVGNFVAAHERLYLELIGGDAVVSG